MNGIKTEKSDILIIGIGNSGRSDDGLGWKFVDIVSQTIQGCFDAEYRYQLQVEDAELVSKYSKVIFADASGEAIQNGFKVTRCKKAGHYFFSSHLQTPETILYLAETLFNKAPEAYTVAINGQNWGLGKSISKEAEKNLGKALEYFSKQLLPSIRSIVMNNQ
jgi:hydrogenase maturation protease